MPLEGQQMGSGEWLGLTLQRVHPGRVAERVTTVGDKVRDGVVVVVVVVVVEVFVLMLDASIA
jgi:hypothetical protein